MRQANTNQLKKLFKKIQLNKFRIVYDSQIED